MRGSQPRGAAAVIATTLMLALAGCGGTGASTQANTTKAANEGSEMGKEAIERALDLRNMNGEWSYDEAGAWTLAPVTAVTNPEIADEQGVSVCVPAAYVSGIDTNGDSAADVTADNADAAVAGNLVIDYDATITSSNGQVYTAATAPVIVNTGAAGYSEQQNQTAGSAYASEGYVNVACGNRGKQSTVEQDGKTTYTGDAPSCLVDQKDATRFVKFNILLGNLPGSVDHFVSTGGSGGGAHAAMLAATSNNPDFYPYEAALGAVGVYEGEDGSYSTTVTVDGKEVELSDGMWGCIAYSAITPLAEGDTTMAFEYHLDSSYDFNTPFQAQLAELLSAEYMDFVNGLGLTADEGKLALDVNGDGDMTDVIALTVEHDDARYADTNGYGGSYLDLYLAEFESNLNWYLDNLDYAEGWTWFGTDGTKMSDEGVAGMTSDERAQAFLEGRYAKGSSGGGMGPGTDGPGGMGAPGSNGDRVSMQGGSPGGGEKPSGTPPDGAMGDKDTDGSDETTSDEGTTSDAQGDAPSGTPDGGSGDAQGSTEEVGTPDAGTTQSATSGTDSSDYSSFNEMVDAYAVDIAEIEAGDTYGNNIVELYDPMHYIGATDTDNPTWSRVVMGAAEGDMSMFASLNMELAWLAAGTDAVIEWQWDDGHVPSEVLGDSLSLYVDEMYGKHVDGAVAVEKPAAEPQTTNGDADEATGTDISSWVGYADGKASFSLASAVAYRTAGAAKAIPGFDTIDYGQEDYVFGSATKDARHWDKYVLTAFQDGTETLSPLFNAG